MQRLTSDLSEFQGNLGRLLARYELNLSPDHKNALKTEELQQMLELLDVTRARLDTLSRVVTAQLELQRQGRPERGITTTPARYETVAEASARTRITKQKLYSLLNAGKVPGAQQIGYEWRIPQNWPASLSEN